MASQCGIYRMSPGCYYDLVVADCSFGVGVDLDFQTLQLIQEQVLGFELVLFATSVNK